MYIKGLDHMIKLTFSSSDIKSYFYSLLEKALAKLTIVEPHFSILFQ